MMYMYIHISIPTHVHVHVYSYTQTHTHFVHSFTSDLLPNVWGQFSDADIVEIQLSKTRDGGHTQRGSTG